MISLIRHQKSHNQHKRIEKVENRPRLVGVPPVWPRHVGACHQLGEKVLPLARFNGRWILDIQPY